MKVRGDFLGPPRSTDKTTLIFKVSKDAFQESIQSSTTPDPGYQWDSDKLTVIHHKREPRDQLFPSRLP